MAEAGTEHSDRQQAHHNAMPTDPEAILAATGTCISPWVAESPLATAAQPRYRWTVELFFRWLKCVLGCKEPFQNNFYKSRCYFLCGSMV